MDSPREKDGGQKYNTDLGKKERCETWNTEGGVVSSETEWPDRGTGGDKMTTMMLMIRALTVVTFKTLIFRVTE
jgi:hypothetical protein